MPAHVPASSVHFNFKQYFPGRNREAGFTLLEILVAFIIAAIALAVLFGGAVDGLRASRTALGYEEAVARARSHLAAARVTPLPGDTSGDDGSGYRWRLQVRAVDGFRKPASPQAPPPAGVTLYAITVWISWRESGQTREVRLDSESLMPDRPTSPSPAAAKG